MEFQPLQLGQKIKKLRELKNFTQSHVASELGITQSAYSKMELGETELSYSKLTKIAEVFGMAPEEIMTFNEQMIFNVMHNQTGNGFVVNKGISDNEKKLYEDQIVQLKEEVSYLKKVLDKLLKSDL
ncbi:MAG: helix-turn-helix transcriptional regulator [Sphingobacteriales bacterium]|nr:helix-turn-helix transcriptional regulator [Sphingobacteriales bacterium]